MEMNISGVDFMSFTSESFEQTGWPEFLVAQETGMMTVFYIKNG